MIRPEAIRYAFAGPGAVAPAELAGQNRLFPDVGNDLQPGVIDHHHSVTPDSGVSLRGLGARLEEAEARKRARLSPSGKDGREEDPVTGAALPPRPGYDNADPWYDGRAHADTIVDAPRGGTVLTADEIEQLFLDFGEGRAEPLSESP